MWDQMSSAQQLLYMCGAAGNKSDRIDASLIWLVEENMRPNAKSKYVELLSAEVCTVTYRGLSDAQIQTQETTERWYFNLVHMPAAVKARCAWHALENVDP